MGVIFVALANIISNRAVTGHRNNRKTVKQFVLLSFGSVFLDFCTVPICVIKSIYYDNSVEIERFISVEKLSNSCCL